MMKLRSQMKNLLMIRLKLLNWKDNRYCNGGNLPRTYIIGNQLHYQDYKWYEAFEDSELKDEALRNKAIMKGFINEGDDESHYKQERRRNIYTNYDDAYEMNHEDNEKEELSSDKELEGPMKDQPLSADASPTALSPGYIVDFNPEEDKEDPEEDPADHPADG
ncbi:hypothetical protein Tco_0530540 [Tanacetum coccineum]